MLSQEVVNRLLSSQHRAVETVILIDAWQPAPVYVMRISYGGGGVETIDVGKGVGS